MSHAVSVDDGGGPDSYAKKQRTILTSLVIDFVLWLPDIVAAGTIFFDRTFESKFIGYSINSILLAMLAGALLFYALYAWAVKRDFVYNKKLDEKTMRW